MDDAAWAALTLSLTVLGGVWTWLAFRRHGAVAALRALGFTLLPLAAYLTKTLQMFTRIVNAVTDWATNVAFSPVVWLGMLLGGVGIVLIVVSGMIRSRQLGKGPDGTAKELPAARGSRSAPVVTDTDPEMAEIEAILRKRGIS
ncbi:hypothetical protein [Nocardioides aquiterrae]|uniref:Cellulose synthase n=1 Tax=Nocardioides aquiterrae TaxID=203799 RepID=A0ABP4F135_9ACTN